MTISYSLFTNTRETVVANLLGKGTEQLVKNMGFISEFVDITKKFGNISESITASFSFIGKVSSYLTPVSLSEQFGVFYDSISHKMVVNEHSALTFSTGSGWNITKGEVTNASVNIIQAAQAKSSFEITAGIPYLNKFTDGIEYIAKKFDNNGLTLDLGATGGGAQVMSRSIDGVERPIGYGYTLGTMGPSVTFQGAGTLLFEDTIQDPGRASLVMNAHIAQRTTYGALREPEKVFLQTVAGEVDTLRAAEIKAAPEGSTQQPAPPPEAPAIVPPAPSQPGTFGTEAPKAPLPLPKFEAPFAPAVDVPSSEGAGRVAAARFGSEVTYTGTYDHGFARITTTQRGDYTESLTLYGDGTRNLEVTLAGKTVLRESNGPNGSSTYTNDEGLVRQSSTSAGFSSSSVHREAAGGAQVMLYSSTSVDGRTSYQEYDDHGDSATLRHRHSEVSGSVVDLFYDDAGNPVLKRIVSTGAGSSIVDTVDIKGNSAIRETWGSSGDYTYAVADVAGQGEDARPGTVSFESTYAKDGTFLSRASYDDGRPTGRESYDPGTGTVTVYAYDAEGKVDRVYIDNGSGTVANFDPDMGPMPAFLPPPAPPVTVTPPTEPSQPGTVGPSPWKESYDPATGLHVFETVGQSPDGLGALTEVRVMRDASGASQYPLVPVSYVARDAAGRLIHQEDNRPDGSVSHRFDLDRATGRSVDITFDLQGRYQSLVSVDADGGRLVQSFHDGALAASERYAADGTRIDVGGSPGTGWAQPGQTGMETMPPAPVTTRDGATGLTTVVLDVAAPDGSGLYHVVNVYRDAPAGGPTALIQVEGTTTDASGRILHRETYSEGGRIASSHLFEPLTGATTDTLFDPSGRPTHVERLDAAGIRTVTDYTDGHLSAMRVYAADGTLTSSYDPGHAGETAATSPMGGIPTGGTGQVTWPGAIQQATKDVSFHEQLNGADTHVALSNGQITGIDRFYADGSSFHFDVGKVEAYGMSVPAVTSSLSPDDLAFLFRREAGVLDAADGRLDGTIHVAQDFQIRAGSTDLMAEASNTARDLLLGRGEDPTATGFGELHVQQVDSLIREAGEFMKVGILSSVAAHGELLMA